MPKLVYEIDCRGSALEIAAQALAMARVKDYAETKRLAVEERNDAGPPQLILTIPVDELNGVLDELLFAGLLHPLQEIRGRPSAQTVLHERFSTLTWSYELD